MKRKVKALSAIAIIFVMSSLNVLAEECYTNISATEAKSMIDTHSQLIIVDVREENEYCDDTATPPGHIPGALNYPWSSGVLEARYNELPINAEILVHCRSGHRGSPASAFLCANGYTNIYHMSTGYMSWQGETAECCYSDIDCDDGIFCNGQETCLNLNCQAGTPCPDEYFICSETNDTCTECVDDNDCDGFIDSLDNCFITSSGTDLPNGPERGTCVKETSNIPIGTGIVCYDNSTCETDEICQMDQEDWNNNGIGDACECYADIDSDGYVGFSDLVQMKIEFNSSGCTPETCQADIDEDGSVGFSDLIIIKVQFGKTGCPVAQ